MNLKSVILLLMLANYLLLAGSGYVSRPEQDPFMVLMQSKSTESHRYESRQYMRTDALEAFLVEALTNRYNDSTGDQNQLLFSVVSGVDAHSLPALFQFEVPLIFKEKENRHHHTVTPSKSIALAVFSPPELAGRA